MGTTTGLTEPVQARAWPGEAGMGSHGMISYQQLTGFNQPVDTINQERDHTEQARLSKNITVKMRLSHILFVITTATAQSPVANTLDVSRGIRQFTTSFLNDLELSTSTNFVFSPFSIHSVFTQLLFGAEGNTRAQLQGVLGISDSEVTRALYTALTSSLRSDSAQLFTANELALAQGFKPKPAFSRSLGNGYHVREYDFVNKRIDSVRQINENIQQNTGGHITDLLLEDDVDALTQLLLLNAIYFKAQWKTAFNPADTFNATFNSPVSGPVNTSFMVLDTKAKILETEGLTLLELPYADQTMSMILVLPDGDGDINTGIAERLVNLDIGSIREVPETDVAITIPKFNMKYQTYLKDKMEDQGLTELFNNRANLQGISDLPLYVSNGIHQAAIEVNEEGSEAAAATAVVVGLRTIQRKKRFYADKPFIFMIYDFQNNIPLFAGKVIDPTNPIAVQRPPPVVEDSPNSIEYSDSLLDPKIVDTTKVADSPNLESCPRLIRDFPNALDNHKICNKVKEAGQFLDWLRENRNLCEQSADHYNQFMKNDCSPLYCKDSAQKKVDLTRQFTQGCSNIDKNNQQECKNIENQVKAYNALNC